jgi:low temperature requirement protein LtrA
MPRAGLSTAPDGATPAFPAISVGPVVRTPDEEHRASTPLELFVDLCFVVAVSQSSTALQHELVAGHIANGVVGFLMAFFGVWWAWMNFTWFASAHDANDVPYRLLTLVQIAGVLVYAAAVPATVEHHTFTLAVVGYVIMRMALVTQWLRVARHFPELRARSMRYAIGITCVQLLWLLILATPTQWAPYLFALLATGELLVPQWAESAARGGRYWRLFHPGHIEERYGLFTLIVLGESVLSATVGIQEVATRGVSAGLLVVAIGGLLIAFSAWWLYFDHPGHLTPSPELSMRWGALHVIVFTSLAALGAGLHVAAEAAAGEASARTGALAVAIPVAGDLLGLVVLMVATRRANRPRSVAPKVVGAIVVVLVGSVGSAPATVVVAAIVMVVMVVLMVVAGNVPDPARR